MSVTLVNNENNERYEFETIESTRGPKAVDFSKLFETTGFFFTIQGILSTAGCQSKISYVNGKKGELYYRGHRIEEI